METELILLLNDFHKVKKFTELTSRFDCNIDVFRDKHIIDGKSVLGIYTIDLLKPVNVRINSDDEEEIKRFNEVMEEFK